MLGFLKLKSLLILQETSKGKRWTLVKPLCYVGMHELITVPAGFETDLASTPRLFWAFLPPFGLYAKAAVVHDYLYNKQPLVYGQNITITQRISRKDADGLFRRIMRESGVGIIKRYLMYWSVRAFGFISFNRHRKQLENANV